MFLSKQKCLEKIQNLKKITITCQSVGHVTYLSYQFRSQLICYVCRKHHKKHQIEILKKNIEIFYISDSHSARPEFFLKTGSLIQNLDVNDSNLLIYALALSRILNLEGNYLDEVGSFLPSSRGFLADLTLTYK